MQIYMNDHELKDLGQVSQFLAGSTAVQFTPASAQERYAWLAGSLKRFDYYRLSKGDKGKVRQYLRKMTGYSRQQLTRLVAQYRTSHWIGQRKRERNCFSQRYTQADILLLAETDICHQVLSGPATKKLFERAYTVFKDPAYERLAGISVSHLYNLRKSTTYTQKRRHFTKTQHTVVAIGERRKPNPQGAPGYLRVDTVHQGDQDGVKGVYHINAVDEVTQMEIVCSVEKISEQFLMPVLEMLIEFFPFKIKGIHTDNGSEYINKRVGRLLQKLLIELTKSRARHSNDNALVESKNGSILRKHMGYIHIPQRFASQINVFYKTYLNPYINYHRPCYFATTVRDAKGKERKKYLYEQMMTPYEKLKSLPNATSYLNPGITFGMLDKIAMQESDLVAAKKMQQAKKKLFSNIFGETEINQDQEK
jgi:transposase InsO family protein